MEKFIFEDILDLRTGSEEEFFIKKCYFFLNKEKKQIGIQINTYDDNK